MRSPGRRAAVPGHPMRVISRVAIATAALVAAVVIFALACLPPAPGVAQGSPDPTLAARTMRGAFHVHSQLSDGAQPREAIAAAAARAGLQFVVFTDHGDGTRPPIAPTYLSGVLCVDAVEISTNAGHYVALDLGGPAPYRLGGEGAAVAEDVRRLGGFGIVAHPDSARPALAWHDWTAAVDGVEWMNADSAWRNEGTGGLVRTLAGYLTRPAPALAATLERPEQTLRRWDATTRTSQMPVFAGHDAHGGVGGSVEGPGRGLSGVPSYQAVFGMFSTRAVLAAPPRGDAPVDARLLVDALRRGRSYTAIDALGAPGWLEFGATRGDAAASMGEVLGGTGPATFTLRTPRLEGATAVLIQDGRVIAQGPAGELMAKGSESGAYRAEVRLAGRDGRAPWLMSNPIYMDLPLASTPTAAPEGRVVRSLMNGDWRVEKDPSSTATWSHEPAAVVAMHYQLGGPGAASPFAALVVPLPQPAASFDGLVLDVLARTPSRISVQVRSTDGRSRWGASIDVSPAGEERRIPVSGLLPLEAGTGPFDARSAASVLLVVDLVNSTPGSSGALSVRRLDLTSNR